MSESNRRHNDSRTQQRNWDETSNQRNFENTNYDQNTDAPRLTQSDPYSEHRGYQSDYAQDPGYSDWNSQGRSYQDQSWQRQRYPGRSYTQQQPYSQSQFGSQFSPEDYNNPYWRESRQFGNQQFGNNFRQPQYNGQQFGSQQFGGQPFSNYPGPQQHGNGNNSGRWNEGSRWNESNSRDTQNGNNSGRSNNFGSESNWDQNRQGSLRINEQGSLWSSGPHKGKGPKGYHRSDDRIKEDISDRLMEDGLLDASRIQVEVDNSEVILSGNVDSRDAKRRAEELCESIPGINNVENRLHVSHENSWNEKREGASIGSDSKRRGSLAGSAS